MTGYIIQRLVYGVMTFILITIITFGAVRLLPGDTVLASFSESGFSASPELIASVRKDLGLDRPVFVQYVRWVGGVLHGNFGRSFISGQPVSRLLRQAIPVTIELAIPAVLLAILLAVPLGVAGGLHHSSPLDYVTRVIAVVGITVPSFVIAMAALVLGVRWFHWVPPTRYRSLLDNPWSNITQFALPAVILGYSLAASLTRMVRSSVLDVLHQDYVRTARAKGLSEQVVLGRHVLRSALIPVLTLLGLQVAAVLGGAVVIESIFNLPGIGLLLLNAVTKRDFPVIQAGVLFAAAAVLAVNLLVDLSYTLVDPRIRHE